MPVPCGAFLALGGEDLCFLSQLRLERFFHVKPPGEGIRSFFPSFPKAVEERHCNLRPLQHSVGKGPICALSVPGNTCLFHTPPARPEAAFDCPYFPSSRVLFPPSGPKAGEGSAQYSQVPFWAGRAAAGPRRLLQRPAGSPGWEPCTGKKLRPFPNGNGRKGMS